MVRTQLTNTRGTKKKKKVRTSVVSAGPLSAGAAFANPHFPLLESVLLLPVSHLPLPHPPSSHPPAAVCRLPFPRHASRSSRSRPLAVLIALVPPILRSFLLSFFTLQLPPVLFLKCSHKTSLQHLSALCFVSSTHTPFNSMSSLAAALAHGANNTTTPRRNASRITEGFSLTPGRTTFRVIQRLNVCMVSAHERSTLIGSD